MIDIIKLNNYLSGNIDNIIKILEALNCKHITISHHKGEIRCERIDGGNPTAVLINADSLRFYCFSTNEKGNIYTFVMLRQGVDFRTALTFIADLFDVSFSSKYKQSLQLPFGGFFKGLSQSNKSPELYMKTYSECILEPFKYIANTKFLRDGISLLTQNKFRLGFDDITQRITIPQWDLQGHLVGVMGRSNLPTEELRWFPIVQCQIGLTLFGYHINYQNIQQAQTCIITESSKGVMQLDSMGYPYGLATSGNNISDTQAKYLKSLMIENLILAYDHGQNREYLESQARKLLGNKYFANSRVGYIYDSSGKILCGKEAPTDLGKDKFKKLVKNHIIWLKE